jgi:hypothetical protein
MDLLRSSSCCEIFNCCDRRISSAAVNLAVRPVDGGLPFDICIPIAVLTDSPVFGLLGPFLPSDDALTAASGAETAIRAAIADVGGPAA